MSGSRLLPGLGLHLDRGAVHAGGLEQGGEYLGGPFGAVKGEVDVPAAGVAVVAGDAAELFQLGAELTF
jgi:hypothetical protein